MGSHRWQRSGKEKPHYAPIINFAGDPTNPEKYGFGGTWFNPDVKLRVFTSPKDWGVGRNIEFVGSMPDIALLNDIRRTGGFGLIWSGDPYWLEYMKHNCSFKLSTYLAAGLPVIVNSGTPAREIIEKKTWELLPTRFLKQSNGFKQWRPRSTIKWLTRLMTLQSWSVGATL